MLALTKSDIFFGGGAVDEKGSERGILVISQSLGNLGKRKRITPIFCGPTLPLPSGVLGQGCTIEMYKV